MQGVRRALDPHVGQWDLFDRRPPADAEPIAVEHIASCDQPVQTVDGQDGEGETQDGQSDPYHQRR
jgi:hypothetical protein